MSLAQAAALVAATLLAAVVALHVLLVAGLPFGRAAWGGRHEVLPTELRMGSFLVAGVLALAGWIVLARADLVAPGSDSAGIRVTTWILTGHFALNTAGNLVSRSRVERTVMAATTAALVLCFAAVAAVR